MGVGTYIRGVGKLMEQDANDDLVELQNQL